MRQLSPRGIPKCDAPSARRRAAHHVRRLSFGHVLAPVSSGSCLAARGRPRQSHLFRLPSRSASALQGHEPSVPGLSRRGPRRGEPARQSPRAVSDYVSNLSLDSRLEADSAARGQRWRQRRRRAGVSRWFGGCRRQCQRCPAPTACANRCAQKNADRATSAEHGAHSRAAPDTGFGHGREPGLEQIAPN